MKTLNGDWHAAQCSEYTPQFSVTAGGSLSSLLQASSCVVAPSTSAIVSEALPYTCGTRWCIVNGTLDPQMASAAPQHRAVCCAPRRGTHQPGVVAQPDVQQLHVRLMARMQCLGWRQGGAAARYRVLRCVAGGQCGTPPLPGGRGWHTAMRCRGSRRRLRLVGDAWRRLWRLARALGGGGTPRSCGQRRPHLGVSAPRL